MNLFVLIVGVVVFAITVYGTVMGGGMAFTKRELAQNPIRPADLYETNLSPSPAPDDVSPALSAEGLEPDRRDPEL